MFVRNSVEAQVTIPHPFNSHTLDRPTATINQSSGPDNPDQSIL